MSAATRSATASTKQATRSKGRPEDARLSTGCGPRLRSLRLRRLRAKGRASPQTERPQAFERNRTEGRRKARCRAWLEARRVRASRRAHRPDADLHRARHRVGDVERALLL